MYTSVDTKANVLSFSEVEDKYRITYIPQEAFNVHLDDRDIEFHHHGTRHWRNIFTSLRMDTPMSYWESQGLTFGGLLKYMDYLSSSFGEDDKADG